MGESLKERVRRANIVLAVLTPVFLVAFALLRDASESVLGALGLVYFLGCLAGAMALDEYAERRQRRD